MKWISVLVLGFFLGMRHSTDADHVVAVTTIVSQQKRLSVASLVGMAWGIGHTLTILLIGSAIIYLKLAISPHVGLSMEFSVGVMIVVLGLISLKHVLRGSHAHDQTEKAKMNGTFSIRSIQLLRPFIVGLVHGMAGSAAVSLLVLNAISNQKLAFIYLLIFGLGTVLGMMLVTLAVGFPYVFSQNLQRFHHLLSFSTAVFSIGFGLLLMYELGIENGLFTNHPVWNPE